MGLALSFFGGDCLPPEKAQVKLIADDILVDHLFD